MLEAVLGDIIGSTYVWHNAKAEDFILFPEGSRFTDDTVLSVAAADKILNADKSTVSDRIKEADVDLPPSTREGSKNT